MSRDKSIDRLRGFAMLWVIVVHVLYWGDFYTGDCANLVKSFCLFEMPLFFFITGAANSFSRVTGYFKFVIKRFQRILVPYWVFALICAALSIVKYKLEGPMDFAAAGNVLLSWMIPTDNQMTSVSYLILALWFVPVYLCVVPVIPVLKSMKQSAHKIGFGFLLAGVFAAACLLNMGWIRNVLFYVLWTYLGLFYSEIKEAVCQKRGRKVLACIAAAGALMLCILSFAGCPLDMQKNKFPPNMIFLVFSTAMMAVILLALPYLNSTFEKLEKYRIGNKILTMYSNRSMTIFLYQAFAFHISVRLAELLVPGAGAVTATIKSLICLVTTIPICAGLAMVFGKIEDIGIKTSKETQKTA